MIGYMMIRYTRMLPAHALMLAAFLFSALPFAPAAAQSPDAMDAARELMTAMKAADQYKAIMPSIFQAMKDVVVQKRPEVERDYDAQVPVILEAMNERLDEVIDKIAGAYARNFTAQELLDMTAFYRTPTGQKMVQRLPDVMKESLAIGQQFGRSIAADLQSRMIEALRKKGHNI